MDKTNPSSEGQQSRAMEMVEKKRRQVSKQRKGQKTKEEVSSLRSPLRATSNIPWLEQPAEALPALKFICVLGVLPPVAFSLMSSVQSKDPDVA